jgi:site-specific recombinase XerD
MQNKEISQKVLNQNAVAWITKLQNMLVLRGYGKGSIRNYVNEMILLFKYFNLKQVEQITQHDIEQYMLYIKQVHLVGRAKCRSVAQSCRFFFKRVCPSDYIVPSNLYPKKQFILPNIMSEDEVAQLFAAPLTLKEYCVVGYSTVVVCALVK